MKRLVLILALLVFVLLLPACGSQQAAQPTGEPTVPVSPIRPSGAGAEKKAADSPQPAAGICEQAQGEVVSINAGLENPPSPRCTAISPEQVLLFRNDTGGVVQVTLGQYDFSLQPGGEMRIDRPAGEYLQPGVHYPTLSEGFASAIWLRAP